MENYQVIMVYKFQKTCCVIQYQEEHDQTSQFWRACQDSISSAHLTKNTQFTRVVTFTIHLDHKLNNHCTQVHIGI